MTYIITSLCLRDSSCVDVCPVDCIVPGKPVDKWPWFYIDPDTCIDCGACVPECPYDAIFPEDEVPSDLIAKGDEVQSMPAGTAGFEQPYSGENKDGEPVKLSATKVLEADQEIDLTPDIKPNYDYFESGPGYKALETD
ncbi:MAG: ferredoxin family protein [Anaerolineales bacterium]|jgi:ferredoxin